jgi:predicted metalloprotease
VKAARLEELGQPRVREVDKRPARHWWIQAEKVVRVEVAHVWRWRESNPRP